MLASLKTELEVAGALELERPEVEVLEEGPRVFRCVFAACQFVPPCW